MKISLIVPVYNGEKYIERNFKSVCEQIFRDFEVIYVNDGSKDATAELLNNIKQNHKADFNIKIINKTNNGVSSARNAGMDVAEGEYFCFLDVDDEILPDYLSYMLYLTQKYNVDLVFCATSQDRNFVQKEEDIHDKLYTKEQVLYGYLLRTISTGVWSMLCKADKFKENNFKFAEGYRYSEDIHMMWRLFNVNNYIVGTNKKLYIYYQNPGSAMAIFNEDKLHSIELMKQLEEYFKKTNLDFSPIFKKYAVARMYWSVLWQCALKLDKNEFKAFCKKHNIKIYLKKLISFKSLRVSLSSILGIISLKLFRYLALKIAQKKVH